MPPIENVGAMVVRADAGDLVAELQHSSGITESHLAPDWRHLVTAHRAADLFPMMSGTELDELARDIEVNGLRLPLSVWRSMPGAEWQLLDGRNRIAAMARLLDGEDRIKGAVSPISMRRTPIP